MFSETRGRPLRLKDMIAAIKEIQAFTVGMEFTATRDDPLTLKAVLWNLSVVGEAARHAPAALVTAHPEVP